MSKPFTEEQKNFLRENCSLDRNIIRQMFVDKFNRDIHYNTVSRWLVRMGLAYDKRRHTDKSTVLEELSERYHSNGHIIMKVKGRWVSKARYVYSQHHNVKLTSNDVIVHLDGDKTNDHIDNLKLSNRRVMAKLLKMGLSDKVKPTALAIAELELKIKDIENEG